MTAQRMDGVLVDGVDHALICKTGADLFCPEDYGMPLDYFTTANRKGYASDFEIVEGRLFLRDLGVYSREGSYPPLNDRAAVPSEDEFDELHWYRDVRLPIDYTGVMVLGNDSTYSFPSGASGYFMHMASQSLFCWEDVLGIELEGGRVVQTFSLSDVSSRYREEAGRCRTEADEERLSDLCYGSFGFMGDVEDFRREAVDRHLALEFEEEIASCADFLFRRLAVGETRGAHPIDAACVPYVPMGCNPLPVEAKRFEEILRHVESGKMTREDASGVAILLWWIYRTGRPHLAPECSMVDLDRISDLLDEASREGLGDFESPEEEEEAMRSTCCPSKADLLADFRGILDEALER